MYSVWNANKLGKLNYSTGYSQHGDALSFPLGNDPDSGKVTSQLRSSIDLSSV